MILQLLISALLTISAAGELFDEGHIVSSFAVISDVHINGRKAASDKFISALSQLKAEALKDDKDGLDAVLLAGDLIDWAYNNRKHYSQVDCFRQLYESCLDPATVPMIYTPGNHDLYGQWTADSFKEAANIRSRLGDAYFTTDIDMASGESMECRHCVVRGVHILTMLPVGYSPVVYAPEAIIWLDTTLASVTASDPDAYVLVLTHPMTYNTVYGSELGTHWYSSELNPVFEKYPQAVVFGGHLHFALNDPRSIWQGSFTSIGTASVSYMAVEDGGFEGMRSQFVMKDCYEFSQGLLLQFDDKGNMRVRRMDFHNEGIIGEDWLLEHPTSELSHLERYAFARRIRADKAPRLRHLRTEMADSVLTVHFDAAEDDEFAHHYILRLENRDSLVCEKRMLADFYKVPNPENMKSSWDFSFGVLPQGRYTIKLVAVDSWGKTSNELRKRLTVKY